MGTWMNSRVILTLPTFKTGKFFQLERLWFWGSVSSCIMSELIKLIACTMYFVLESSYYFNVWTNNVLSCWNIRRSDKIGLQHRLDHVRPDGLSLWNSIIFTFLQEPLETISLILLCEGETPYELSRAGHFPPIKCWYSEGNCIFLLAVLRWFRSVCEYYSIKLGGKIFIDLYEDSYFIKGNLVTSDGSYDVLP